MMSTDSKLTKVKEHAKVLTYDNKSRIVLMSDCHRGVGNWGDNFLPNQNLFFAALTYYDQKNYTYIELGDGDELWENRSLEQIVRIHSNAYWIMSRFYQKGRFYMLYGNHDKKKQKREYVRCNCENYYCESTGELCKLFPQMEVYEGILLRNSCSGTEILLTHGHQGDFINDTAWLAGKFLVRYVWRRLELIGMHDPTSAAKNYKKKGRIEKRLSTWADRNGQLLVTGHTHRSVFPAPGESLYFNDGSCVHPRCITALEIENNCIALVKWSVCTREDRSMYIGREVLEGPVNLEEYAVWKEG